MRKLLCAALLLCVSLHAQIIGGRNRKIFSGGTPTITETQATIGNNYTGTSLAYGSNVASGQMLIVTANANAGTGSISGSGTGCASTSWTLQVSNVIGGTPLIWLWTGLASGSGPCTVSITGTSGATGIEITAISSSGAGPTFDTAGTSGNAAGSASLTVTASGATTATGDYCLANWALNGSSPGTSATGWTSRINETFTGTFRKTGVASGTTATITFNFDTSAFNGGVLICIKP